MQMIHMKNQAIFSSKDNSKKLHLFDALRVKSPGPKGHSELYQSIQHVVDLNHGDVSVVYFYSQVSHPGPSFQSIVSLMGLQRGQLFKCFMTI